MFKELISVWKGRPTFLDEIVRDFENMLGTGHQMFDQVTGALFEGRTMEDLKKEIYKQDSAINMQEQTIRQKIVTQLVGGAEQPIAACLILMSISKDAERLGDYIKNILEIFEVRPRLGKEGAHYDRLETVKVVISSLFAEVTRAYHNSNKKLARKLVKDSYEQQKICDQNIKELLLASPAEDYVAYAVLSRFFKRILAHLANIASSIFMPVTKIDFFDERLRDEELKKLEP